jgi:hypothetical protein
MTMFRAPLSRRTLLRGAGVAIGLPMLEAMIPTRARAQSASPQRYVVMFGGHSLGCDGTTNAFAPNAVGPGYDLSPALTPLGDLSVQNDVSVISGLKVPWAGGGAVPAGGRPNDFHVNASGPLLCGVRASGALTCNGPTSDQLVAAAIAGSTTFKSLVFRAQPVHYAPFDFPGVEAGFMSYQANPAGGAPLGIQPVVSPQAAFNSLFSGITTGLTPDQIARKNLLLRGKVSVLDLVGGETQRLVPKLGVADQLRISRHLDEIRELERRISAMPPAVAGSCQKPTDPGMDPPVGADDTDTNNDQRLEFPGTAGTSNEDLRARVFCDLITMAFACDQSRVASLMLTEFASAMNVQPFAGFAADVHFVSHGRDGLGGTVELNGKVVSWHVKQFAYLVSRLKATPDGAGTLLDNSALVYVCEGGWGTDATGGTPGSHSTENMGALIAGRAGGLKPGKHVAGAGRHPGQVIASAMNAVGVPGNLGEVQGNIPELFT